MTMTSSISKPRSRGFTLIEMMIVVSLLGIIGTMLTTILVRQQRFHRAVASLSDSRARMRDIATILPTDMRGMSTAGGDVLALSDTSIQFRAFVGTSIVCAKVTTTELGLPPKVLASGSVLTAWIAPPRPNDIAYLYSDGSGRGNADDSWIPLKITDTTSSAASADASWCPTSTLFTAAGDATSRRYKLTFAAAMDTSIHVGAAVRFAREVRYSIYQASDDNWYVGYQTCTPNATYGQLGSCGTREVLAGPVQPGAADTTSSGMYFVFYNKSGTRLTAVPTTDTIARITVGVRTLSQSLLKATTKTGGSVNAVDSIRFTIGLRNRI